MTAVFAQTLSTVKSPDGKIEVVVSLSSGLLGYNVSVQNEMVLKPSGLGVIREDADLSKDLVFISVSPVQKVSDSYKMLYAKMLKKETLPTRPTKRCFICVMQKMICWM
jgi:hypothetical protein